MLQIYQSFLLVYIESSGLFLGLDHPFEFELEEQNASEVDQPEPMYQLPEKSLKIWLIFLDKYF